jgi:hypothetical protein
VWFFNPFAWQCLFFLGGWLGWRGNRGGVSWLKHRWFFYLAAVVGLAGFVIRFSWTLHDFYDPLPVPVSMEFLWPLLSKGDLGFLRFANVLAVALLVSRLIHPQAQFFATRGARPFLICGRNSLHPQSAEECNDDASFDEPKFYADRRRENWATMRSGADFCPGAGLHRARALLHL